MKEREKGKSGDNGNGRRPNLRRDFSVQGENEEDYRKEEGALGDCLAKCRREKNGVVLRSHVENEAGDEGKSD